MVQAGVAGEVALVEPELVAAAYDELVEQYEHVRYYG